MSKRKTHEQFVKELQETNPSIEVLGTYQTALTQIQVRCSLCGKIWETKPNSLLSGNGCPECGKKKKGDALRKSNRVFLEELALANPMIEALEEYKGNKVKILLYCRTCGNKWTATPHDILSGHGCPKCGYKKQKSEQRFSHQDFLEKLLVVNPDIDVLDEYINSHTKIRFQCKSCGRIWKTVPNSVLLGHGCPDCARSSTSFLEQVILYSFRELLGEDAVIARDRELIGMELDIVIPSLKVAYEPGSWAWHYNKRTRDTKKRVKCEEIGYQLITIYTDYKQDAIPYDSNCYTSVTSLGNSNWEETKLLVKRLLDEQKLELSSNQWDKVRKIAIEKSRRRTHIEYIEALSAVNPKVEVIDKYIDNSTRIRFRCLVCGRIWDAMPSSVLAGHGCPTCGKQRTADSKRKTHEQFCLDVQAINPNISFLGEYVNSKTKILCICCVCGNKWEARPQNLLKGQGCPICGRICAANKNRKTQDQFIRELEQKNPTLIVRGQYVNSSTKIAIECKKCGYLWQANPMDILNGHGCPKCAGSIKRNNTQFISELKSLFPNIEPLDEYRSANEKIQVRCLICGYVWSTRPHDLLRSKGCPFCRKRGNKNH